MSTHETELVAPVDLTTADGRTLNPAARGWSRVPLHTARLSGPWGRRKRWDYWAILAGDVVVSGVVANIDYLGLSDVWWCDLASQTHGGRGMITPGGRGVHLPDRFGSVPVNVASRHYRCTLRDTPDGAMHIEAHWTERSGVPAHLDATIALPDGHESLNLVIPWNDRMFQYTSKHQARPASGTLSVGDDRWVIGEGREAWGVLDIGRGRWPTTTHWNWGGGAGRTTTGAVVGLQFGAKWTEGTGFTENGVTIDGRLTKIGRELEWTYRWDDPMAPWRVRDPRGQLDVTLSTRYDKHTKVNAVALRQEVHQVFGRWSGWAVDDDGVRHEFEEIDGFAEECRARW